MVSADLLATPTGIWIESALIPATGETAKACTPLTVTCPGTGVDGNGIAAGNVTVTVSLPCTSSPRPPVAMVTKYPAEAPATSLSG